MDSRLFECIAVEASLRTIAGPSGSFAISVEKSVDLQSWSPVLLQNTSDPVKAFYRLQIQH